MKYGYLGVNFNEIIKKYKKEENSITVTYLDNSTKILPNTKEQEQKIIENMIQQAYDRDKSNMLNETKSLKDFCTYMGLGMSIVTAMSCYGAAVNDDVSNKFIFGLLAIITGSSTLVDSLLYNNSSEEIEELKKYRLFLSIMKQIEDSNEYNNININTIDDYSLKDIKKIKKNLGKN